MSESIRVVIVEDDVKLAGLVEEFLTENGFSVLVESRGDRAEAVILREMPELVILDLMLPGLDGLTVCRRVRPKYPGPILMLTARGDEVDEVVGLELGADDYLAKPVKPRLLLARIKALLRRAVAQPADRSSNETRLIEIGSLQIDAASRTVRIDGNKVELTSSEFDLLWFLAQRAGQVVSREVIYSELRGIEYDGIDRSIDLRVARLRKKLGDDGKQPKLIKSVRGAGYLLAAKQ